MYIDISCYSIFFTCKSSHSQKTTNPEARKLNDSAVKLDLQYNGDSLYERKIALLNQAIKLDSTYFTAYWNKFTFQNGLKQYEYSVLTGKQMIKLEPNDVVVQYLVGEVYEKMDDTVLARQYYERSLATSTELLKKINSNTKRYKSLQLNQAIALILLRRTVQGDKIIKELYNTAVDTSNNETYRMLLNMKREEFINGKTVSN